METGEYEDDDDDDDDVFQFAQPTLISQGGMEGKNNNSIL